MRIGHYLLAGALFGAPILLICFAADAHVRYHHNRVHAAHLINASTSTPVPNQDALKGAHRSDEHVAPNLGPPQRSNVGQQPDRHPVGTMGKVAMKEPESALLPGPRRKKSNRSV
jgi:hypothetical protein